MKLSKIKDKGFKILFILLILSSIADLVSTLKVGELIQYLEANPFYSIGGLPLIILLNFLVLGAYYFLYTKSKSPTMRFVFISSVVALLIIRTAVIYQNLQVAAVASDPQFIEAAKQVTQQVKDNYFFKIYLNYMLYLLNPIISFLFFKLDHKIEKVN